MALLRDPVALKAWAKESVPDTIAEAWSIIMICLVGAFAVSCINVRRKVCMMQALHRCLAVLAVNVSVLLVKSLRFTNNCFKYLPELLMYSKLESFYINTSTSFKLSHYIWAVF